MSARKTRAVHSRSARTNTPRPRSPGHQSGSVRRFLLAFLISATASFSVASYSLIPSWRDQILVSEWVQQWVPTWISHSLPVPVQQWLSVGRGVDDASGANGSTLDWSSLKSAPFLGFLNPGSSSELDDQTVTGTGKAGTTQDQTVSVAFARCPEFLVPGHTPVVPAQPALRELCFSSFAILHSGLAKTPVFVAQKLNRAMLRQAQAVDRQDRFYEEARLPERERAKLADYRGSGHARGHMAPAGDMHTPEAMAQSFSLANMVPQNLRQNSGPWNQIEQATRKYVMRARGDVYVFTGPIFARGIDQTVGQGRVAVPSHVYKVVYDPQTARSWVHWQPNRDDARVGPPISYAEFVKRTGLHLLPASQLKTLE